MLTPTDIQTIKSREIVLARDEELCLIATITRDARRIWVYLGNGDDVYFRIYEVRTDADSIADLDMEKVAEQAEAMMVEYLKIESRRLVKRAPRF
ncbi:MAG: hypothetical protein AAF442_05265 [Pseudomonadota bacterium]